MRRFILATRQISPVMPLIDQSLAPGYIIALQRRLLIGDTSMLRYFRHALPVNSLISYAYA